MDKQSLIDYIKSRGLNAKIEEAMLKHIERNEFGDQMIENVAKLMETAADMADVSVAELDKVIEKMEALKSGLENGAEEIEELTADVQEKYMEEVSNIIKEEETKLNEERPANETPAETVEVKPVEETPIKEVTPVQETPVQAAPVQEVTPVAEAPSQNAYVAPQVNASTQPAQQVENITPQADTMTTSTPQPAPFPGTAARY